CMMWIRCSTGRLCVYLTPPTSDPFALYTWLGVHLPCSLVASSLEPPKDSKIMESTPLDVYHYICSLHLGYLRDLPISPDALAQIGAIITCAAGTRIEDSTMIAGIPGNVFHDYGWSGNHIERLVMEDGWTRCVYFHSTYHALLISASAV
ncbi:hypothetical protein DFH09DRAFT_1194387, partial [Mycena vulgaris]